MAVKRKSPAPRVVKDPDDEDEDDLEDDESEKPVFARYNTATHIAITHENFSTMLQGKATADDAVATYVRAQQAHVHEAAESFNAVYVGGNRVLLHQLETTNKLLDAKQEHNDLLRKEVADAERRMSEMIRQSEDAKLERERLAADLERSRHALQRYEMELETKQAIRKDELDAVVRVSAPV